MRIPLVIRADQGHRAGPGPSLSIDAEVVLQVLAGQHQKENLTLTIKINRLDDHHRSVVLLATKHVKTALLHLMPAIVQEMLPRLINHS